MFYTACTRRHFQRDPTTGRFVVGSGPPEQILRQLYVDEQLSCAAIGERVGVSRGIVRFWMHRYEIPLRSIGDSLAAANERKRRARMTNPQGAATNPRKPSVEELRTLVHEEHKRYVEIAGLYGVSVSTIGHWVKAYGLGPVSGWVTRLGHIPKIPTKEELAPLYESGKTLKQIGDLFALSEFTVARLFREAGLEIRSGGWSVMRRYASSDSHKVRSTYELLVDEWLVAHRVEHSYEPRIPGHHRYRADFIANGWYIEIWGVTKTRTSSEIFARYQARRTEKTRLYHALNLPLVEIEAWAFASRLNGLWERRLAKCLGANFVSDVAAPYRAA